MKILNNFFRIVYSLLILFISIIAIMMINGVVDSNISEKLMNFIHSIQNGELLFTIVFTLTALLSIVSVFVSPDEDTDPKRGMLMDYDAGNVLVTKETFENIASSVAKKYGALKASKVSVELNQEGMDVNVYTYVVPDTVVSDITMKLQKDIKETISKLTTVKVSKVNIKIKGIYTQIDKDAR